MKGIFKNKKVTISLIVFIIVAAIVYYNLSYYKGTKVVERLSYSWGMGIRVTEAVSNNRDYEWYVDQRNTGKYGNVNCGPAACEMVLKWVNKDSTVKTEDIRKYITPIETDERPGMNYYQVEEVLKKYGVNYKFRHKDGKYEDNYILKEIKSGKIFMMGLDMFHISMQKRAWHRCGSEYKGVIRHWVVIKGYKVVEGKTYLEAYDPFGFKNGGKDRYYLLDEVSEAFKNGFIIDMNDSVGK